MHIRTAIALLLLGSCDGSDVPPVVASDAPRSWYGSSDPALPEASSLERALHGGITVPPDRGLAMVDAEVIATSRGAALRRARQVASELAAISEGRPGCSLAPWAFEPAERRGEAFHTRVSMRLDVTLAGTETLEDRHARVEACLTALDTLDPARFEGIPVRRSPLVLTVDDPSQHRGALLEQRMAALHAIAATNGAPPQFDAAALRCTSSGEVRIEGRSLRGIDLAVDFTCAPDRPAPIAR